MADRWGRRPFRAGAAAVGAVGGAALALGATSALAGGAQTPIVDAHVHLWDNTTLRVPWIDTNPVLNRPYLPADYSEHTAGTGTAALVYVEVAVAPPYAALEPDWVLARARQDPRIQGLVVWAPVEFGELALTTKLPRRLAQIATGPEGLAP